MTTFEQSTWITSLSTLIKCIPHVTATRHHGTNTDNDPCLQIIIPLGAVSAGSANSTLITRCGKHVYNAGMDKQHDTYSDDDHDDDDDDDNDDDNDLVTDDNSFYKNAAWSLKRRYHKQGKETSLNMYTIALSKICKGYSCAAVSVDADGRSLLIAAIGRRNIPMESAGACDWTRQKKQRVKEYALQNGGIPTAVPLEEDESYALSFSSEIPSNNREHVVLLVREISMERDNDDDDDDNNDDNEDDNKDQKLHVKIYSSAFQSVIYTVLDKVKSFVLYLLMSVINFIMDILSYVFSWNNIVIYLCVTYVMTLYHREIIQFVQTVRNNIGLPKSV